MRSNIFIYIILCSTVFSQAMYLNKSKGSAFAVTGKYHEGAIRGKDFRSCHDYGIGFSSVIDGQHELGISSRKNNIDNSTWKGFSSYYNYFIKPSSPVKYFFGTLFSRFKHNNDIIEETEFKFGLYGDIKGSKSTGLSYYPFFYIGRSKELYNFLDSSLDERNSYEISAVGLSLMFKDTKTTGIGIEPVYINMTYKDGDRDCINYKCDYKYYGVTIYLFENNTYRRKRSS